MDHKLVLGQIRRCLRNEVSGAGTMIDSASFIVTGSEKVEGGTEYRFKADTYQESEFGDGGEPGPASVEGSIVLDAKSNPVTDPEGRVRLKPWTCLDPTRTERRLPEGPDILEG